MSREIKFRVWDGYQMSIVGPPGWIDDVHYGIAEYRQGYESFAWMQYTGLKDNNGVEIYEGDIIEYRVHVVKREPSKVTSTEEEQRSVVEWEEVDGAWIVAACDRLLATLTDRGSNTVEVIGNIYENPELVP